MCEFIKHKSLQWEYGTNNSREWKQIKCDFSIFILRDRSFYFLLKLLSFVACYYTLEYVAFVWKKKQVFLGYLYNLLCDL